jgi:hypothetical protein
MKIKFILTAAALFACLMSINVQAQDEKEKMDVDTYIATGKNIIIAKILSIQPLTRGGDHRTSVEVLHVVKGSVKSRELRVVLKWMSVEVGKIYLLRTENDMVSKYENFFQVKGIESLVEIYKYADLEELKTQSVQFIVVRVMDMRKNNLENAIRHLTDELARLKQITKKQQ